VFLAKHSLLVFLQPGTPCHITVDLLFKTELFDIACSLVSATMRLSATRGTI